MTRKQLAEMIELGMKQNGVIEDKFVFFVRSYDDKFYKACALGLAWIGFYAKKGKSTDEAFEDYRTEMNNSGISEYPTDIIAKKLKINVKLAQEINVLHQSMKYDSHAIASGLTLGTIKTPLKAYLR